LLTHESPVTKMHLSKKLIP